MVDYGKGKIYKITGGGLTYIGSTIQPLHKRFNSHKKKDNCETSKLIMNYNDVKITLIEDFPCERKEQLLARERYWIEKLVVVNKVIPTRTPKEYYNDNIEMILEKQKEYYNANIEENREISLKYYYDNQERLREQNKKWKQNNKEKVRETTLIYTENNKDKIQKHRKEYYEERKVEIQERRRPYHEEYRLKNREAINQKKLKCNLTEEQYLKRQADKRASRLRCQERKKQQQSQPIS